MRNHWTAAGALVVGLGLAISGTTSVSAAPHPAPAAQPDRLKGDGIGTPRFEEQSLSGAVSPNAVTIPSWSSSFTDPTNQQAYRYTMVGAAPGTNTSTTVPTVIIPMRFTFADGTVLDGSNRVADTLASPVFQSADIGTAANATASAPPDTPGVAPSPRVVNEPSDVTQVGDAINRAQFGKSGSPWHVTLGQPSLQSPVSITVPRKQGLTVTGSVTQASIGLMSASWFSAQLNNVLVSRHISSTVLPIFLVDNTFLYVHTLDNCCVLGYHGATSSYNGSGRQQVNTYMFAAYSDQGIFGANPGDSQSYVADIHALSHEVQEWYDDPFVNNLVDPWLTPTAPQYGCTAYLETGDPVVGYGFEVGLNGTVYHPEDEVHLSWFARQSPSTAEQHYYTYLNNFAAPATGC